MFFLLVFLVQLYFCEDFFSFYINLTLALVFHHVSKHLELSLKNSAAPRFSTSVLGVWKHDETLVQVFDILHEVIYSFYHYPSNSLLKVTFILTKSFSDETMSSTELESDCQDLDIL